MCSINIAVPTAVPLLTTERRCSGHFPDKEQLEERKEGVTFGSHFQRAASHGG